MATQTGNDPLRLPLPLKAAGEQLGTNHGTRITRFVAVAEKVSAMARAEMFEERRAGAGLAEFDRSMARAGGEPPRPDDALAEA